MKVSPEVEKALTQAGGRNFYGKPNYRFAWSGQETQLISNGKSYEHFRVCAEDCWLLMKWEGPEFWGSEEEWNANNIELPSGLYTAGPYPRQGRYRVVRTLKKAVIKGDVMEFEYPAPDLVFVREMFPLIRDFLDLTTEEKSKLLFTREEEAKAKLAHDFGASRENYRGIATAKQVQDRTEAIERFLHDPVRVKQALELTKRRPI